MRDSASSSPPTPPPKLSLRRRLQLFWERLEDPRRQKRYSFYFTLAIHALLILLLVGQVHWQIKLVEPEPIGIRYAEPESAPAPVVAAPVKVPPPVITPVEAPPVEPPPVPPVVVPPPPPPLPAETTLALPSALPKKEIVKPLPKPELKPLPKPELKPVPKPEVKPKPQPKPEPKKAVVAKPVPKPEPKKVAEKKVEPEKKPPVKATAAAKPLEKKAEVDPLESLMSSINRVTQDAPPSPKTSPLPAAPKSASNKPGSTTGVGGGDFGVGAGAQDGKSDSASAEYKSQIQRAILQNINYPEGINNNPQVTLLIEQNEKGEVQSVNIEKSSGIHAFDEAVVRAVYAASPLPLPKQANMWSKSFKLVWRRFEL